MSLVLFGHTVKRNWGLLLIFIFVLSFYMTVMTAMYNPDDMGGVAIMVEAFPAGLTTAMGFDQIPTDLSGFLASWLYGMLMMAFPMVYSIILGHRLVAKMVDNGSFAYLLSTPLTRARIIVTKGVYALVSMMALFAALFAVGTLYAEAQFPGKLNVAAFLSLNITTMLLSMSVMMIVFFFSCLFNQARYSLGLGAGVPVMFLLMNMLGGSSPDLAFLSDISIFGLIDPMALAAGESALAVNLQYGAIITVLFVASVVIFVRKRLPL